MLSKSTGVSFVDLWRSIRLIPNAASGATSTLAQFLALLLVMMAVASNAIAEDYTFTTFAGSASLDGTGTNARFSWSTAVAVDASGTVYVADTTNHTIRKITAGGVVTTLAGLSGASGSANGTGAAARFYSPSGLTVDSGGNVYVADKSNRTVRKITTGGVVTTIAGTAGVYGTTDGPGSSALFSFTGPTSIAIDSSGVLYVLDDANGIRKIDVSGTVSTLMPGSFGGICVAADGFMYVTGTSDSPSARSLQVVSEPSSPALRDPRVSRTDRAHLLASTGRLALASVEDCSTSPIRRTMQSERSTVPRAQHLRS